jgi:hypothetical protein
MHVSRELGKNWVVFTLGFLILLAGLVLLLPTAYTLGILKVVSFLLGVMINFLFSVFNFVWLLIVLVFGWLVQLFRADSAVEESFPESLPQFNFDVEPQPYVDATSPAWFELAKSYVFWGVFAGVVILAVIQYLRQNEEVLQYLKNIPVLRWLGAAWRWMKRLFRRVNHSLASAVSAGLERLRTVAEARRVELAQRMVNVRGLSPRQQIYFFFLAMLRRAAEGGVARKASQTPYEYAQTLEGTFPEIDQEVSDLTATYVEARYSRHAVDSENVSSTRKMWARIRLALRRKKKRLG